MKLSKWQKRTLELLIDKYERSKQYKEDTESNRAIMINPTDVYGDYDSDFADVDEQRDFEIEMLALKDESLVDIRAKGRTISRIELVLGSVSKIYNLLKREPLKDTVKKQIDLYQSWLGKHLVIDKFCSSQIELLKNGKKAKYEITTADNLLKLLEYVLSNEDMILERELSIVVFGDTKVFEKEYRSKLVSVLMAYGDYEGIIAELGDEKEITHAILEELNVYSNPSYVFFKGNGVVVFKDDTEYVLDSGLPMAMPIEKLKNIKQFILMDSIIMTVENLASYNRIHPQNCFCIYLAGYHNTARQTFIKMINSQNPGKRWRHFGDIDPDGFMILENLKRKTGVSFEPAFMDVNYLDKYGAYTKPLQANDIAKANSLIEKDLYADIMHYMLNSGRKLEQEVISWMEKI